MPVRRASAIVLRSYRVGEADKMVVFFTLEHGKLRGMARSARRPRSRFGGSLEVGTEIELTFFEKESRELVSVDRCDIVRSVFSKLGEPILASTLAYLTDLVDAFAPEREPNERLYRLLRASVVALSEPELAETRARYFEAWLLRLGGLYPRQRNCGLCGRPLRSQGGFYVVEEHRFGCHRCLEAGLPVSPEAFDFVADVWKSPPAEIGSPGSRALRELGVVHHRIIRDHLERELKSYPVIEALFRAERPS